MPSDPRDKIRNPNCEECALHEEAEHVCLMGDGPIPCKVMVVGEAPGHREDEEHRAFVGPAGQLLNACLEEAGLNREDVYISNVARCRPPDNRTPTKPEIKTCVESYLWREIKLVKPKFLLMVGNSALYGLTKRSGIKKHRGTTYELEVGGRTILGLATYHPAAILRNPYLDAELRADFHRFGREVRGESSGIKTSVKLIRSKRELAALCRALGQAETIVFDIETNSGHPEKSNLQYWWDTSAIVSISFSWRKGLSAVVPLWHNKSPWRDPHQVLKVLKPYLEDPTKKYVNHNIKFDAVWLAEFGIYVPMTFDTMVAAHMLNENRSKGLKPLSQIILGADAYDVGEDLGDAPSMPIKRLAVYNAKDTDYTYRLYRRFRKELMEEKRTARIFTKLMMPAERTLAKVELGGIQLDQERLLTRTQQAYEVTNRIRRFMLKYLPDDKKPDSFDTDRTTDLMNFNSPQQVADWFFNDLDLPILEETAKGHPSTRESVLLQLAKRHAAPKALLKYRKWAKYISTYLHPWQYDHRDEKWRLHPTYKLYGTVTGRLSCGDPNLQNVPRDPFLRSIIGAREGWSLVEADYAQIELRLIAMVANDPHLQRVFLSGGDPHLDMAVEITRKLAEDISAEERKKAKSVNFGFSFGMGAEKYVSYALDNYDVEVSGDEAIAVREAFFIKWPSLQAWHDRQRRLVHRYGRVLSPIGRIRHLPDVQSQDKKVRAEAERQAINSPIQSCASDLMLLSMVRLDSALDSRRARVVGSVHDSLLFEVQDEALEEVVPLVKETMEDVSEVKKKFGTEITVPLVAEVKVGKHWGESEVWNVGT